MYVVFVCKYVSSSESYRLHAREYIASEGKEVKLLLPLKHSITGLVYENKRYKASRLKQTTIISFKVFTSNVRYNFVL